MQSINHIRTLQIQTHLTETENQIWRRYNAPIAFAAGGGLSFVLLGFFLLAVFTLFDGDNSSLNYAGVGSLIAAFTFFGIAAHFMDKRDASEHQFKKSRIAKFRHRRL